MSQKNLYNKAYASMKENVPIYRNSEDLVAGFLESAGKYMRKATVAAKEDRFVDRSDHSDNALMLISGILGALDEYPAHEKHTVKNLQEYCALMNSLIIRMNVKNDGEMAENITTGLFDMAKDWKRKADLVAGQDSSAQETLPSTYQDQPEHSPPQRKTPYGSAHYQPSANIVG